MLKKTKIIASAILATVNAIVIVAMLIMGYSSHIQPTEHPMLACIGLPFPAALAANTALLVVWLLFSWKKAWLPLLGFIVCYQSIRTYLPLNYPQAPPEGAIKVLSYNVQMFNDKTLTPDLRSPIADYIAESGADIVCLQEAKVPDGQMRKALKTVDSIYQYRDTTVLERGSAYCMTLYSKYPILRKRIISYPSGGNFSVASVVSIDGKEVTVINNHLESNRLNEEIKDKFTQMVKGDASKNEAKKDSKQLIKMLAQAVEIRAPQADSVANYIAKLKSRGASIIVCGDFNDHPLSYVHHTIAKDLTDCYVASGNGPGASYNHNLMLVRIDNILCSDDWEPYGATVDRKTAASDHYPIYCWLKKR